MFMASYSTPWPSAPSPKKQAATCADPRIFAESAAPVAIPALPATMALAPRFPVSGSAMCIDPPFPRQYPAALPNSSANMRSAAAPLARQWPWPRCVLVM